MPGCLHFRIHNAGLKHHVHQSIPIKLQPLLMQVYKAGNCAYKLQLLQLGNMTIGNILKA